MNSNSEALQLSSTSQPLYTVQPTGCSQTPFPAPPCLPYFHPKPLEGTNLQRITNLRAALNLQEAGPHKGACVAAMSTRVADLLPQTKHGALIMPGVLHVMVSSLFPSQDIC